MHAAVGLILSFLGIVMRQNFLASVLVFTALNLFVPSASPAQAGNGELTGNVRDSSEKAVPGAQVVLTEQGTNLRYESTTNDAGVYEYPSLKPGRYSLAVEKKGFDRYERQNLTVRTGERLRVDVGLAIGAVATRVVVREDASLLRTESATLGQVIDSSAIPALP